MHPSRHSALAAASLAALFCVAGCGERSDDASATQGARSARQEARESVASGATSAKQKAGDLATSAKEKANESASATRRAAPDSGTNVMGSARGARELAYGTDPATTPGASGSSKTDDGKIASMVLKGLKADKELNPLRIDVDASEGVVTLSGAVPTAAARARAGEIARNVKDVRSVNDQLTVNGG